MIGSRGRVLTMPFYLGPLQGQSVQFMQIIKIVFAITSSEDINFFVIAVSSVHVTGSWGISFSIEFKPFKLLKIKNVQVICS